MFVLLPTFLLLIFSLVILWLQWKRPSYGYIWLLAVLAALLAWGFCFAFRWWQPQPFQFMYWDVPGDEQIAVIFMVDDVNWAYVFGFASLLLVVIIADSTRLTIEGIGWRWVASLVYVGVGMLAALSGTMVTFLLVWSLIDLLDLALVLRRSEDAREVKSAMLSLGVRMGGTFLMILPICLDFGGRGVGLALNGFSAESGIYYVTGVILRLGLVPGHLCFSPPDGGSRGLRVISCLVAPASAMVLLGRLPQGMVFPAWQPFLLFAVVILVLYASWMWSKVENESKGMFYWQFSLAGMAVICVLRGEPSASSIWGISMILSGGLLFLYTHRHIQLSFAPVLGALGFCGLPYTPAARGWLGLAHQFDLVAIAMLFAHFLLLYGYIRHGLAIGEDYLQIERWAQVLYPAALIIMIVAQWFSGLSRLEDLSYGVLWASLPSVALTAARYFWLTDARMEKNFFAGYPLRKVIFQRFEKGVTAFLGLEWLSYIFEKIYAVFGWVVNGVSRILEGDGGVLWALLLLTLLSTLIRSLE